mgnify:CR=1 FL=1
MNLKILGVLSVLVLFLTLIIQLPDFPEAGYKKIRELKSVHPNFVTTIYLKNRFYDTIFEVMVFSLAILGIGLHSPSLMPPATRGVIRDISTRLFTRYISFFVFLGSAYLALWGHESPGGGFSAGVAGGTGLLLLGMTEEFDVFEEKLERFKVHMMERIFLFFIVLSFIVTSLRRVDLIVLTNFMIYLKVSFGTWLLIYSLIKHRGIF